MGIRGQLEAQQAIQDMIAQDAPLEGTLSSICEMFDQLAPGLMSAIMLVDADQQRLSLKAASCHLAASYRDAIQRTPIGDSVGSCGRAAYHRCPIITEDILEDPCWAKYRKLATQHKLRSCWSYPIVTQEGQLLGTFASYCCVPGRPSQVEIDHMSRSVGLVALAVERHQDRLALQENEQWYRSLFTHHPDAAFSMNLSGVVCTVNRAVSRITGYNQHEILGLHYSRFVVSEELARAERHFESACQGNPQHFEVQAVSNTHRPCYLAITELPVEVDGEVVGVYGIVKDITCRKETETQLRLLKRSVESSTNGIVIIDAQHPGLPIVYANASFFHMTGYTQAEVIGSNFHFLQGPETDSQHMAKLQKSMADEREQHVVMRHYRKDGTSFWDDLYISPVPDEMGKVTHFVAVHHDVTEFKANEARLAYHATHDPLTGRANRSLLEEHLDHDYELILRHQGMLEVLFIDLDDFKPINDSLGHAAGDCVLIEVAQRLQDLLGPDDTLARFGGDEFVIVLTSLDQEGQARKIAEQALTCLARPYQVDGREVSITASIGVATSQMEIRQPTELVQYADLAMYEAKKKGRNTVCWYSLDVMDSVNERVTLRRELYEAMERGEFDLHYQPIVRATDGEVGGFEALLRWNHPSMGHIPPDKFISLAEQTGQIIALGQWAMAGACRNIKALNDRLGTCYFVAVNVSPVQFHRADFVCQLRESLGISGLSPNLLEIELTEGVLMDDTDNAIHTLHALRSLGVSVSIDDFGTGYSSLSYLRDLPINRVKLDKAFIHDLRSFDRSAAIVQGIITLAHHLGLQVIAEGIETEQQRYDLIERDCDLCQGYLFAMPMPRDMLDTYLQNGFSNP